MTRPYQSHFRGCLGRPELLRAVLAQAFSGLATAVFRAAAAVACQRGFSFGVAETPQRSFGVSHNPAVTLKRAEG
eukprot:231311-Pyramimonas_sp.AAC.1